MARTVGIGIQSFEKIIENNCLYIDKTDFIREWWESGDDVTSITRPRRFGKTLNMNMTERFYHGFVLGLLDRYVVTSNRESGFGRYDIMLEPKEKGRMLLLSNLRWCVQTAGRRWKTPSGQLLGRSRK